MTAITALPNKHCSGHCRATEIEGDQITPGKRDLEKQEMWTAGFRYNYQLHATLTGIWQKNMNKC